MGLMTLWPQAIEVRPAPDGKSGMTVSLNLGAGSRMMSARGIVLNVSLGIDVHTAEYLRIRGDEMPEPVTVPALVDTGASCLCIDESIAERLKLTRKGTTKTLTAGGPRRSNIFAVALGFPGSTLKTFDLIRAADVDLSQQPFKCLIGRDVMSRWHLHYNGQTGAISISD